MSTEYLFAALTPGQEYMSTGQILVAGGIAIVSMFFAGYFGSAGSDAWSETKKLFWRWHANRKKNPFSE
jgi:hypothetical protein